jgi:hypothetical protein
MEVLAQMLRSKLFAAFGLFAAVMCAAGNPFIGVWKLNNARSKFSPGTESKNFIVTFEEVGDQVKRIDKGTSPNGKPIDRSMTFPWDSVDHDDGTHTGITIAVKRINTRTVEVTIKHEGTVVSCNARRYRRTTRP